MDAIRIRGLRRSFGDVKALDGLDLSVPEGSFFGFLGPNGAGKTTTIAVLSTVLAPDAGRVSVMGHDLRKDPIEVRRSIGLMIENPGFYPELTVLDNLLHHAAFYDMKGPDRAARGLLKALDMSEVKNRKAAGLSFGMRKRLALAQALMTRPKVLLLDEPLTGLDPEGIVLARDLLKDANDAGATIFMSTHILSEVDTVCDRVAIVRRGRNIAQGTPAEIKALLPDGAGRFIEFHAVIGREGVPREIHEIGRVAFHPMGFVLHGFKGTPEDVSAVVNDILVSHDIKVSGLYHREMSLEDAYLDLVDAKVNALKTKGKAPSKDGKKGQKGTEERDQINKR